MVDNRSDFTLDTAVLGRRQGGFFCSGRDHRSRIVSRPQVRKSHVVILHFHYYAWRRVVISVAQTK